MQNTSFKTLNYKKKPARAGNGVSEYPSSKSDNLVCKLHRYKKFNKEKGNTKQLFKKTA